MCGIVTKIPQHFDDSFQLYRIANTFWVKSILGSELFGILKCLHWKIFLTIHNRARPIVHCLVFFKGFSSSYPCASRLCVVLSRKINKKRPRPIWHRCIFGEYTRIELEQWAQFVSSVCAMFPYKTHTKWRDPTVMVSIVFWNLMCLIFEENPDAET